MQKHDIIFNWLMLVLIALAYLILFLMGVKSFYILFFYSIYFFLNVIATVMYFKNKK